MALDLESAVMRKVALRLLPLLGLCYTVNVLDRLNVSIAALTMNKALYYRRRLTGSAPALSSGAMCCSKFRRTRRCLGSGRGGGITLIAVAWGLCSAGTALATNVTTFVIARFLLGMAEAGFFPGSRSS
jgi:ACS family tartrate transporter-like MFS transporter